jgi:Xaa-Pro aminopeptidase
MVETLRQSKDAGEVTLIRKAGDIAVRALGTTIDQLK